VNIDAFFGIAFIFTPAIAGHQPVIAIESAHRPDRFAPPAGQPQYGQLTLMISFFNNI